MRYQLPQQPNNPYTVSINLDNKNGHGSLWVVCKINPRGSNYFDSYGLAPPGEFLKHVRTMRRILMQSIFNASVPICGQAVLNVIVAISTSTKPPYKDVHEYTEFKLNQ